MRLGQQPVSFPIPSDVLQRVSDGVVGLDAHFCFTYVNPRAERILAHAHEDLLGRSLWSVFPDLEGTDMERLLRRAQTLACPLSFPHNAPGRDAMFAVRVYPDADGLSIYFSEAAPNAGALDAGTFSEPTPRWFQTLVQNTSEAIYLKDCGGRYRFMNEAAAGLFGLTPAEAIGKRDADLFDAESAAAIREMDATLLRTRRPQESETVRFIEGKKHVFLTVKAPYEDETGAIAGIMGMSRTITERIGREQALRTVTREYRVVLHNAEDAIFLVDVHHSEAEPVFRFRWISPAHESVTGMSPASVAGKTPREIMGEAAGAEVERNYRRCVWLRQPIAYEEEPDLPGGTRTWHTKLAPVLVEGEVRGLVGIARDITERVKRERELQRRNRRLSEFADVVAHDLRNPLHVTLGRIEKALATDTTAPLEQAVQALQRMDAIIVDTLTLARQGRTVATFHRVDLADVARDSWSLVETSANTLHIEDDIVVHGDANRLRHIFENLFRNAVEHGGPDVSVRIGRAGERSFFVADDGPGIRPERRMLVFEPGHTSTQEGTGFGLAIVRRVAEAHGWQVQVAGDAAPAPPDAPPGACFLFSDVDLED